MNNNQKEIYNRLFELREIIIDRFDSSSTCSETKELAQIVNSTLAEILLMFE